MKGKVHVRMVDDTLKQEWQSLKTSYESLKDRLDDHMARQRLNAGIAVQIARLEYGAQWLLHIDSDELFYTPTMDVRPHFQKLEVEARAKGIWQAVYLNMEALSPEEEVAVPHFEHVSTFKRNPHTLLEKESSLLIPAYNDAPANRMQYFTGYSVGKAAVRVAAGVEASDVTLFSKPPDLKEEEHRIFENMVVFEGPYVLHYIHIGFKGVRRKYQTMGEKSQDLNQIPFYHSAIGLFERNSSRSEKEDEEVHRKIYNSFAVYSQWPQISALPPSIGNSENLKELVTTGASKRTSYLALLLY